MSKNTDKINIQRLSSLLAKKGVRRAVLSPGSRNTPLIIALNREERIQKDVIVDERSAGYYALGLAQRSKTPALLVCTSGTALLNYAPAIAESYYQNIPLIVLSADRPEAWVDQGDSQVIRQRGALDNHIKRFFQINIEQTDNDSLWYLNRTVNEAFNIAMSDRKGPVHINIPICEPLFNESETIDDDTSVIESIPYTCLNTDCFNDYYEELIGKKVMIIASLSDYDKKLSESLAELSFDSNFVILTESVANIHTESDNDIIRCIDRTLSCRDNHKKDEYLPDILISFGGPVISKMFKQTIKSGAGISNWVLDKQDAAPDTYTCLRKHFRVEPSQWIAGLASFMRKKQSEKSSFALLWKEASITGKRLHEVYVEKVEWSDLKAMHIVSQFIPKDSNLQLSNGTSIRYRQLFDNIKSVAEYSNRGTSGIDGSLSTAAGSAAAYEGVTTLITGDLSFLYDINGLWNISLSPSLKIIILNNGGGGIFRFMKGPSSLPELTPFIETPQCVDISSLAVAYGIDYYSAFQAEELSVVMPKFYSCNKCAILNIVTPKENNGEILRDYFKYLRNNNNIL